jgi:hypothetical protein
LRLWKAFIFSRLQAVIRCHPDLTPRDEDGRPTAKYFQSLTTNIGYPKLKEHLGAVIALMKISASWGGFMDLLDRHYPRHGDTLLLPMDYDQKKDDGKGL